MSDTTKQWNDLLGQLQDIADFHQMGYQIIALGTLNDHREEVVAEVLPAGISEYDPEEGKYSDGVATPEHFCNHDPAAWGYHRTHGRIITTCECGHRLTPSEIDARRHLVK